MSVSKDKETDTTHWFFGFLISNQKGPELPTEASTEDSSPWTGGEDFNAPHWQVVGLLVVFSFFSKRLYLEGGFCFTAFEGPKLKKTALGSCGSSRRQGQVPANSS